MGSEMCIRDRLVLFGRDGELVGSYRSLEAQQFAELKDKVDELLGLGSSDTQEDKAVSDDDAANETMDESESNDPLESKEEVEAK